MFPAGLPGMALFALRASVAVALLAELFVDLQAVSGWLQAAGVVLGVVLSLGWATPIAALLTLAMHVVIWTQIGAPALAVLVVTVLDALALCLLGPGAYSLDSYRFGRRVLVVPPR